ncbi:MAG: sigma factor-like helix-turn-helix DNA-binding protein [Acidimicrobiales bacterium]
MAIDHAELQDRLGRLPPRHRAVLRAALVGFDEQDIARLLDIPVESVPTTLRAAVAKLTNLLADRRGPESVPPC